MIDLPGKLLRHELAFVCGVPDSTLKGWCWTFNTSTAFRHVTASCEGSAVALAAGYWISTGMVPVVYLQNSGLPNALNPLMSLVSDAAFDIPMLMIVGWRGRPGYADEPQHRLIGQQTIPMLELAGFSVLVLEDGTADREIEEFLSRTRSGTMRGALVVSPDVVASSSEIPSKRTNGLERRSVIEWLFQSAHSTDIFVGGIGHTSREMMAVRTAANHSEFIDLPCVGAMGFASHVAAGVGMGAPNRRVFCLDGDGAMLMHGTGCAAFSGRDSLRLIHIVFANGCHASVGGQPTSAPALDIARLGEGLGYAFTARVDSIEHLHDAVAHASTLNSPSLIAVITRPSGPGPLPRPSMPLPELLRNFRRLHFNYRPGAY